MQLTDCNLLMKELLALTRYLVLSLFIISCCQSAKGTSKQALYKLLTEGICKGCDLKNADLSHADLRSTNLKGANLSGANLSNSILDNSNLELSDLRSATLYNASLKNVNLSGALLQDADFSNANLTNAIIDIKELKNTSWRNAEGIDINLFTNNELYQLGLQELEFKNYTKAEYFLKMSLENNASEIKSLIALFNVQILQGKIKDSERTIYKLKSHYERKNDMDSLTKVNNIITAMNTENKKDKYGNGLGIDVLNAFSSLSNHLKLKPFFIP